MRLVSSVHQFGHHCKGKTFYFQKTTQLEKNPLVSKGLKHILHQNLNVDAKKKKTTN